MASKGKGKRLAAKGDEGRGAIMYVREEVSKPEEASPPAPVSGQGDHSPSMDWDSVYLDWGGGLSVRNNEQGYRELGVDNPFGVR